MWHLLVILLAGIAIICLVIGILIKNENNLSERTKKIFLAGISKKNIREKNIQKVTGNFFIALGSLTLFFLITILIVGSSQIIFFAFLLLKIGIMLVYTIYNTKMASNKKNLIYGNNKYISTRQIAVLSCGFCIKRQEE
ncbi:hypothetical protein GGQ84_002286 [Desulfitispora alkaliphila]|uniref:hypothetical protein n=1 Tax=Desulfitispora alkaliphila TaxID=622674 RepID=UPI003D248DD7